MGNPMNSFSYPTKIFLSQNITSTPKKKKRNITRPLTRRGLKSPQFSAPVISHKDCRLPASSLHVVRVQITAKQG
ncbi:uncharacterized protein G2W53_031477 [Senna tora]|uniref:Uncharacterized protein n=1 Tax=Senna tora TaxID=362788 RepID=A0A834T874_9FABA|nr:uncharacterized protein G2W53_031477 [Senna tora]